MLESDAAHRRKRANERIDAVGCEQRTFVASRNASNFLSAMSASLLSPFRNLCGASMIASKCALKAACSDCNFAGSSWPMTSACSGDAANLPEKSTNESARMAKAASRTGALGPPEKLNTRSSCDRNVDCRR